MVVSVCQMLGEQGNASIYSTRMIKKNASVEEQVDYYWGRFNGGEWRVAMLGPLRMDLWGNMNACVSGPLQICWQKQLD